MPNTKDGTRNRIKRKAREIAGKIGKGPKPALSLKQEPLIEEGSSAPKLTRKQQDKLNRLNRLLWKAAEDEETDKVRQLAGLGADINIQDNNGWTTFFYAARWGNMERCRVLAGLGADVNAKDKQGRTALHWAAEYGHTKTCMVLCWELLANPFLKDKKGKTARKATDYPEIKQMLKEYGLFWILQKMLGKKKAYELLNAVKECSPQNVAEIFAGL